jgi:hypothetical protein
MESPQTVKATCTFSTLTTGRPEKVDVKFPIPVSAIMLPEPEELTDILASGILEASSKTVRQCSTSNFEDVLAGLSSKFCCAVVEQVSILCIAISAPKKLSTNCRPQIFEQICFQSFHKPKIMY